MARCSVAACGADAIEFGTCVAHMPEEQFDALIAQPDTDGPIVGRGVTIDGGRAAALLSAARGADLKGARITSAVYLLKESIGEVCLADARFQSAVHLSEARLRAAADFAGATFLREASFQDVEFAGDANFAGARFRGLTTFQGAQFAAKTSFAHATFDAITDFDAARLTAGGSFEEAVFKARVSFDGVSTPDQRSSPGQWLEFSGARFDDRASFRGARVAAISAERARFKGGLNLGGAIVGHASVKYADFGGPVWLGGSLFDWLLAEHARFAGAGAMGDVVVTESAWFDRAVAEVPFELRLEAGQVSLEYAELRRGGRLGVRRASPPTLLIFEHLACGAPFTIAAIPRLDSDGELRRIDAEAHRVARLRDSAPPSSPAERPASDEPQEPLEQRRLHEAAARLDPLLEALNADSNTLQALDPEQRAQLLAVRAQALHLRKRIGDRLATAGSTSETDTADARTARDAEIAGHERAVMRNTLESAADLSAKLAFDLGEDLDPPTVPSVPEYAPPLVRGLDDVDLSLVTLAGLDMGRCRFAGGRNLDRSRIDGQFGRTPATARWAGRRIIAEERDWRLGRPHGEEWRRAECGPPEYAEIAYRHGEEALGAHEIAELYRMLRKGREDAKDEPGAADFYYGEMEMRRHARVGPLRRAGELGERTVLWLYWLTSGYGLRALRAAASLLVTVAVFTALFYAFGLKDPDGSVALLQAVNGAAFRSGDVTVLTEAGQYLQIPLRILGPLFFALMLLSLRGRVKR